MMVFKKHIIQHFFARACFVGSTLGINIFFSRLLSASGSGELYYTINNYSLIALISSCSFESGMTFFLAKKEIDDRELISTSIIWTALISVVIIMLSPYLQEYHFFANRFRSTFYPCTFIAGTLLNTYFSALFFARRHFLFPMLIQGVLNIALLCFGVLFYTINKDADTNIIVQLYFTGFLASGIVLSAIYYFMYVPFFSFRWPSQFAIGKLLSYSSLAFITNMTSFFAYRIDYWILKSYIPQKVTDNELGNYIQVAKLVQLFLFVPTIIATVMFPVTAAAVTGYPDKNFNRMVWKVLLFNAAACCLLLITGKWAFVFLFGTSFSAMYNCFVFSIPAILAMTVVRVVASYIAGINQIRYNLSGGLLALVVIILFNLLLIPAMGINGAAVADSMGYFAFMVFLLVFLKRKRQLV